MARVQTMERRLRFSIVETFSIVSCIELRAMPAEKKPKKALLGFHQ